ncbi:hypothetical protein [Methylobacterium sp. SD21]|uniref:hypothetical protein n=1 Tax=Methylobacterium litchii TaxID=3138810 RepID=UPI00313C1101
MPLNDLDAVWFRIHPDRQYRLRKQSPAELQQWPAPLHEGLTGWCIIRKDVGTMELFALTTGETWGDSDEELGPFFNDMRERAA